MLSAIEGLLWPAVPGADGAQLLAALFQLEQSQWWDAEALRAHQFRQLEQVVAHAWREVPFYRARLEAAGLRPGEAIDENSWGRVPLLRRRDVQDQHLAAGAVPPSHGPTSILRTSGSTGEPIAITGTALSNFFWQVFTLRDHLWHRRDLRGRLAAIRATGKAFEPQLSPDWGPPASMLWRTGPAGLLGIDTDISVQARWLQEFDPDYLLTHPSNLAAVAGHCRRENIRLPRLREVRTVGETLTEAAVRACAETFGVALVDMYTSQEIGYLALQCPDEPANYHLQAESAVVEILDDDGVPCPPGKAGRVVVTPLHNFATPLLRYDMRDYAEPGAPCPCGRGLPVIRRILGRERNMLVLPGGERRWPVTGFMGFAEIAPVRQYQFIQHDREHIEVRLATARALGASEEEALRAHICRSLGHPFSIRFAYMEEIPRGANGKFEDFISRAS